MPTVLTHHQLIIDRSSMPDGPELDAVCAWLDEIGEDHSQVLGIVVYAPEDVLIETALHGADGRPFPNRLHDTIASSARRFEPPVPFPVPLIAAVAKVSTHGILPGPRV